MNRINPKKIKTIAVISMIISGIIASVVVSVATLVQPVSAITEKDLMFKALVGGMRECYRTGKMVNPLDPSKYFSYQDAIADKDSDIIVLPTLVGNNVESSRASCLQIFKGIRTGGFFGIGTTQALIGLTEINGEKLALEYKDLGYTKETQTSAESQIKCIYLEYQYTAPGSNRSTRATSNRVCFPVDSEGIVNIVNPNTDIIVDDPPQEEGKIELGINSTTWSIRYKTVGAEGPDPWEYLATLEQSYKDVQQQVVDSLNARDIDGKGFYAFGSVGDPVTGEGYYITATTPCTVYESDYGASTYTAMTFRNGLPINGALDALRYFTGNPDASFINEQYRFTNDDWITLYKIYFQRMAVENSQLRVTENCSADNSGFTYAWFDGKQWCELSGVDSISKQFGWRKDSFTLKLASFADMTKEYMNLDFSNSTQEELDPDTPATDPNNTGDGSSNTAQSKCLDLNAAGSLGWIICPILELTSNAVNWLYEQVVAPFLEINSSLLSQSNGTYVAWQIFQNLANIVAVIFLLVVIFSQVTGVGIDNYGIKKALPKIIIALILINLSYIVCQLAVDLSNIVGKGINDLFNNIASEVTITSINNEAIPNGGSIAATAGTLGVIGVLVGAVVLFPGVGALAGAALAAALPGMLLAVIGTIIGMFVAILMLFALLTLRKVAVVVLVVLSPLAFACYMLPNTKNIFDKWVKFLKNMLLLFPICGLVIGGGNLVSRIILTSSSDGGNVSFTMALAAMLAGIIPFFFVPTLLKGAMNIFGNIGSKLGGLGKAAGSKVKGLAGDTDRFKDFQQQQKLRADQTRAKRLQDQIAARQAKGKPVSARLQRNAGAVNQRIAQAQAANSKNEIWGSQSRMDAAADSLRLQEEESGIKDWMTHISATDGFNSEDGATMYRNAKLARENGNDAEADAWIELAGKTGKAAATFMDALYKESDTNPDFVLNQKTAKRIFSGEGSKLFKVIDPMAYQYAREINNGEASKRSQAKLGVWKSDARNIQRAIDKNGNTQEAFNAFSGSVLDRLNGNGGKLMNDLRALDAVDGTSYAQDLQQMAAEALESHPDASKNSKWNTLRGTTESVATARQKAQTAAQVAATTGISTDIRDNMTRISNASTFNAEDGGLFYDSMVAARDAGNDAEADAYIELAMKNKEAAATFMEKMRTDSTRVLDRKSASRIMRGSNSDVLSAADGIGYQYAREVDAGKVSGVDAATWSSNINNIKTAIEENINNAGAYANQSASVHQILNNNKAALAAVPAGTNGVDGAKVVESLEYFAAEAAESGTNVSNTAAYNTMRQNVSLPSGMRQTRAREAQEAQTAAINTAAATASADAAATRADIAAAQATQIAQAQMQFRQQHIANVEAKRQRLGANATIVPEGYTLNYAESARRGYNVYSDSSGTSHYDSHENKFF